MRKFYFHFYWARFNNLIVIIFAMMSGLLTKSYAQDVTSNIVANQSVTLSGNATITLPAGTTTYSVSPGITGAGTVTIGGTGTLLLEQVNTFTLPTVGESTSAQYYYVTPRTYVYEGYTGAGFFGGVFTFANPDPPVVTINPGATLDIGSNGGVDANILNPGAGGGNLDNIQNNGILRFTNTNLAFLGIGTISGTGSVDVTSSSAGLAMLGVNTFTGTLIDDEGMDLGLDTCYGSIPNARAIFDDGTLVVNTPWTGSMEITQNIYETHFGGDINLGSNGGLLIFAGQYTYSDAGDGINQYTPSLTNVANNYTFLNGNASGRGVNIYGSPCQFGDGTTTQYFLPGNPAQTYLNLDQGAPNLANTLSSVPGGGILSFDYSPSGPTYMDNIISGGGITFGNTFINPGLGVLIVHSGHIVMTQQQFFNGITQIDSGAILQLGDGTHGDKQGTVNAGNFYETSAGDGYLMQAGQTVSITEENPGEGTGSSTGYAGQPLTVVNNMVTTNPILSVGGVALPNGNEMINNGTLVVDNIGSTEFLNISGSGRFVQAGAGRTTLYANMTYSGPTTITGGALAIGTGGSITNSSGVDLETSSSTFVSGPQDVASAVVTPAAGTFDISSGNQTIQDLTGVSGTRIELGGSSLTFGTGHSTEVDSQIMGNGGNLTKIGSGTVTLGGTNNFTGGFNINEGGLLLPNSSGLGNGSVNLGTGNGAGASLGTTGSNHTISIGGNFIQNHDGILILNINGTSLGSYDSLSVQGMLTVNPNSQLTLYSTLPSLSKATVVVLAKAGSLTSGSHFTLIGTNTSLADGATFNLGSNKATINYGTVPGYENEITLTLIGPRAVRATPTPTPAPSPVPTPPTHRHPRAVPVVTQTPTPVPAPTSTPTPAANPARLFPSPTPDEPEDLLL